MICGDLPRFGRVTCDLFNILYLELKIKTLNWLDFHNSDDVFDLLCD